MRRGGMRSGGKFFEFIPGFVQHIGDRSGASAKGRFAHEHVADTLAAPFGMVALDEQDGAFGDFREPAAGWCTARLLDQTGRPFLLEGASPAVQGMRRDADERRELRTRQLAAHPGVENEQSFFEGKGRSRGSFARGPSLLWWLLSLGDQRWRAGRRIVWRCARSGRDQLGAFRYFFGESFKD